MVETAVFSMFHRAAPPVSTAADVPPTLDVQVPDLDLPFPATVENPPAECLSEPLQAPQEALGLTGTATVEPTPAVSVAEFEAASEDAAPFGKGAALSGIRAQHELLGLANPVMFDVSAGFDGADRIGLEADRSGLYRPAGFRASPWSGLAYDAVADNLTGLAAGTRILTARGEVPVEQLVPGDAALALRGPAYLPIVWVGRSTATGPVIVIEPGALGPDRPHGRVSVAPAHPVFIDPAPVPAHQLINGSTIRSENAATELFNVDVGTDEVLFVEGIPLASGQHFGTPTNG